MRTALPWIIPQSFANTSMKNTVRLLSLLAPQVFVGTKAMNL